MARIGIGGIFHETNTFAAPTGLADFQILRGVEITSFSHGARTYLGGLIDETGALGFDAVPLVYAEATPSGTIRREIYFALRDELIEQAAASDLDALLLSIHGAGVVEDIDSLEEDLCSALRQRLGNKVPIVATLDLHGNIRQRLGDLCSALFPVRLNPHVDQHERGVEAARCLSEIVLSRADFETAIEQVPMLFPPVPTSLPVFVELDRLCTEIERQEGVACARIMHGFPYVDMPNIGASVVVVARRDGANGARRLAQRIAGALWERRDQIKVDSLQPEAAIQEAMRDGRTVVVNEFSDNTGAGSPGDGTHLLSALIAAGARSCFSHIFDPGTVAQAAAAGVGARIKVALGGHTNALLGLPIKAEAEVLGLNNGLFRVKSPMGTGETIDLGLLATLRIGGVDVVVSSGRRQTLDDGPFIKAGVDVAQFPILALKSSQHFKAWFEPRFARIVTADPPGLSPVDVSKLHRHRLQRPMWPLSADVDYRAEPQARQEPV
ncbi:M81 family metallopeptidase [Mesorhizobium sp. M1A.F.Ca.ET.072.01.1.1]|uniref:M81 family metallopeptidase n=1 Tax=Mesorhizobium sp. M1A.F.Ca.ET.072.01.1.1 TaxID=2496753 RepID=UPI00167678D8|nr:M81 family metallopeptidase [Mesorhizobium sp. M1A.F.Ca.ET.072.01.1.1]